MSGNGITAAELSERLARGEALTVLDVREPGERAFCALRLPPSAVDLHVPMGMIPSRLESLRAACAGRPTVVYCHHGVRSRMVVDWLTGQGVTGVLNLEGGIDDWSERIDPAVPRY